MSSTLQTKHRHRAKQKAERWPFGIFLSVVAISFLLPLVAHAYMGIGISTVLTGSMQPSLKPGDLVITQQTKAAELASGDVISLIDQSSLQTYMHRIVQIENGNQEIVIHTKGDSNPVQDAAVAKVQSTTTISRSIAVVPGAGGVVNYFTQTQGRLLSLGLIVFSALILVLRNASRAVEKQQSRIKRKGE